MRFAIIAVLCAPLIASAQPGGPAKDPKTERLWKAKCAGCHGPDGKGQTDQGKKMAVADMSTAEWQKKFTDEQIKTAIENGVKEVREGKKKEMEAYKGKLPPNQIDALVAYTRTLAH